MICQTNNPFKGWCNIFIPEDSEVDITLLANKEGCTTGQYIINKLEGQRLTEEIEETEKTLIIQNIPSEVTQNTIVNFTIITQEEGEVVSSALVTITDPEDVQITTRSDNLGMAKFYAGKLGTYTLSVSKDGYITSQEYTVTSRVPRKELIIVLLLNGQVVRELYVGNTYEIGLYSDGTRINETLNGNINGEPITFENGYARYTVQPEDVGRLTITIPQSENYLKVSEDYMVVAGIGFEVIVLAAAIIIVVVVLIIVLKTIRRGGGGLESDTGHFDLPPGEA